MSERDLYGELGVPKGAGKDEIKRAYRKLARELHPDRNPNDAKAEERFKKVSYAHDVLNDERRRSLYDEFGEVGLREGFDAEAARAMRRGGAVGGGRAGGFEEIFGGGRARRQGFSGTMEDLFGGNIDELFGRGGIGGRTATGASRPKPADQEGEIEISFEESLSGVEKEMSVVAGGTARSLRVRIPAGVADGGKVRLRGQGATAFGAEGGDLVLTVRVAPHKVFRREGDDLHLDLPVTLLEAWKGASLKVPTPDGEVSLKVPRRVAGGAKLRLRGKGVVARGGGYGDLIVHVQLHLPDGHDHGKILRALEELEGEYTGELRAVLKA